mmetsp:Transcript_70040/g.205356  ORF Transcript_70040/g.205356 Transcript_70040/m.205356 type:complete len:127 (+) Transcript_70040:59-439(+)
MVKLLALALCAALAGAVPATMLRQDRKVGACAMEQSKVANPELTRGDACKACTDFVGEGSSGNAGLCTKCYSVVSACNDQKYAWNCYDQNEMFEVFQKNPHGADSEKFDEPDEMHKSFDNKEPKAC